MLYNQIAGTTCFQKCLIDNKVSEKCIFVGLGELSSRGILFKIQTKGKNKEVTDRIEMA